MTSVSILGMGPGSPRLLTRAACEALAAADAVVGARRLVEGVRAEGLVREGAAFEVAVRAADIAAFVRDHANRERICVLMSGDTGLYSGAARAQGALRELEGVSVEVVPGISSVQYFAACLGRPWQDWRVVSAHGVAIDEVQEVKRSGKAPTLFICGGATTPDAIAGKLAAAGFFERGVSAGEELSYAAERVVSSSAGELAQMSFGGLSLLLVEGAPDAVCAGGTADLGVAAAPGARAAASLWPWAHGGIADELFERGRVPMTKQEVRAALMAKLRVAATDTVFDIGAGTGSVSIELALAASRGRAYAIEQKPEAVDLIRRNIERFGVVNATVVPGVAPAALAGLPVPDAAFIGGTGGKLAKILATLLRMNPRVRVCLSCITLETLADATGCLASGDWKDVDVTCVNVSRADAVGGYHLMRAQNPVWLLSATGASLGTGSFHA